MENGKWKIVFTIKNYSNHPEVNKTETQPFKDTLTASLPET
jgi:hypothetical protein